MVQVESEKRRKEQKHKIQLTVNGIHLRKKKVRKEGEIS